MKAFKYIMVLLLAGLTGCSDIIDLYPESNISTATYYSNYGEIRTALTGCYRGLQKPLLEEWKMSELRSDNSIMGVPGSTSSVNYDLSFLDEFYPSSSHQGIYNYWLNTYNNIRSANLVLNAVKANYNASTGKIEYENAAVPVTEAERKSLAAEASFIRAYHYFNLVRLYGGVFLIHEAVTPAESKTINRSSKEDIYKLIEADLVNAAAYASSAKFGVIPAELGLANKWSAKALLAKVYLTLNRKAEAAVLLNDVVSNSGYGLESSYANVFSISNEMNKETLFAIRFKAGGLGMGNTLPNLFAPLNSGSAVINGDGSGNNTPAGELNTSYAATDVRKAVNIGVFGTGTRAVLYVKKYISVVTIARDAENDWPVIRYSDVLLMLAEANGNTPASMGLINQVHTRAGLTALPTTVSTAVYEKALADERRWEFAFENQRFFDLLRLNVTSTTLTAEKILSDHFAVMYPLHYSLYPDPKLSLSTLQANADSNHMLLPIPQYEIDTNSFITIPQNDGY
ncbi:RagB/SusD domain-containing protein [Flavobacterium fluvii]|uniref:RagB/SusD domain-containing protein n=1 Tax=Flavobacterium fluvii TaxID=468056 RepID=A0A1M5JZS2_9FLAO|nr:RagB/SusD family nutrient uptake outer membrane protein [Flavobacterium fluvii]SHG45800.1 RagB/SusD domain-containing protein [Flavobacterium fluvii]